MAPPSHGVRGFVPYEWGPTGLRKVVKISLVVPSLAVTCT